MRIAFAFPMHQLWFWFMTGTVVVALAALGLRYLERCREQRLRRLVDAHLIPRLAPGNQQSFRRPLFWYPLLAVLFLIVALAQPHWGDSWKEVQRATRELLIVLDTSESMRAEDVAPNRLERAKLKIHTLLEKAPADRVGLVAFAGAADLQSPLTVDHGYFKAVLSAIDTDTISLEGSDLESALIAAASVFQKDDQEKGASGRANRAVILLSDGEEVSGDAIKAAEALSLSARLYVLGIGTEEGTTVSLPEWYARFVGVDNAARPHESKLNREVLSRLALTGGGVYLQNTNDNWDIDQLLQQFATLSARDSQDELRMELVNRYQWFLALAVIFVAAEGVWLVIMPYLRRRYLDRAGEREPGDEQYA